MAFTVDNTVPGNAENESLGASRIRNVAGWVLALFGLNAPTTFVNNPFAIDVNNLVTVQANPISSLGIATKQYVDSGSGSSCAITNGGSGSAFTGTLSPPITAYVTFARYVLAWTQASQGNDTVNLNGLGALTVKKNSGGALVNLAAGDVPSGSVTLVVFDGVNLEIVGGPTPPVANTLLQVRAYKPTDQSVTSSIALVNDTALSLAVAANEIWQFELDIYATFDGASASGIKSAFTTPAGATLQWNALSANVSSVVTASGTALQLAAGGTATTGYMSKIIGQIINGATPGTLQFQWAQETSDATATKVKAGSSLVATRMSP